MARRGVCWYRHCFVTRSSPSPPHSPLRSQAFLFLPHPLAHHCPPASPILHGCCDAVRGHGSRVHSQTRSGALDLVLSSSTRLFPSSTDARVLIGFGHVPDCQGAALEGVGGHTCWVHWFPLRASGLTLQNPIWENGRYTLPLLSYLQLRSILFLCSYCDLTNY
jgi:hypothetical protein